MSRRSSLRWILWLALAAVAALVAFLVPTGLQVMRQAQVDETRPAGAIIVFGAAEYAGRPSPVYRARLDHAYELYQRRIAPVIITSGGAAWDPKYTEGGVGRDYLIKRGVPDEDLIAETQSDDTADSAARTSIILRANAVADCDVVSDAYHMYRVKQLMAAQGVKAYASPRPDSIPRTRWGRWTAALREAFSVLLWRLHLT